MTSTPVRALTMGPVFVYGAWLLATGVSGWPPSALIVAAVLAVPLAAAAQPRWLPWLLAPSILMFLFLGALTWSSGGAPTGDSAVVVAGVFLGLPLWFLGVALGSGDRPAMALVALGAGLFQILTVGATLASLPSRPPPTPAAFVSAWYTIDGHQIGTFTAALSSGGLAHSGPFPLSGFVDPVFLGLSLLALAGVLLPLLGTEDPPVARTIAPARRDLAPSVRRSPPPVLYATAERPTPARPAPGAGLVPVGGAVAAAAAFVGIAALAPNYAFLGVTVGVAVSLVILVRRARPRAAPRPSGASRR